MQNPVLYADTVRDVTVLAKHVYVQATCQRDPEVYTKCHDPKIYPHTKFGIPTSNYIQICSGLDLARTETRGQVHSDLEPVGGLPGPKMYLHTKYGTATINNIDNLLWAHFFKTRLLRSRSQWLKTVSDIP